MLRATDFGLIVPSATDKLNYPTPENQTVNYTSICDAHR
jgi:hypothetical protein